MSNRKKHSWILIICVLVLAVLIFFEPALGWRLREWLNPQSVSPISDSTATGSAGDQGLLAQNETLRAQLAALQNITTELPQAPANTIRAMVYAQYPFGFKNNMLLNAGTDQGVATGSAVTFQGIFIGTVQSVFANSSIVQTIFDPSFKMPVRIGSNGIDALLVGGAYPDATSIAKDAPIEKSDIVYTAAPGLPYGLPIGFINATTTSPDNLFIQASVGFAYQVNEVQTVLIMPRS